MIYQGLRDFRVFGSSKSDIESRRADSNRLPLLQLRVCGHVLQGVAQECKSRISKPVTILRVAACCTVLRSRWCQSGINRGISASRSCSVVALI